MTDSDDASLPGRMNMNGPHHRFCDCERCEKRDEGYFGFYKNMTVTERLYYTTRSLAWTEEHLHSLYDEIHVLRMDLITLADALE